MAKPYRSLELSEGDQNNATVLATPLDNARCIATIREHCGDPESLDEWEAHRGANWRNPPTLGELRDFLGY